MSHIIAAVLSCCSLSCCVALILWQALLIKAGPSCNGGRHSIKMTIQHVVIIIG